MFSFFSGESCTGPAVSCVTAEEGSRALLQCPGFVPEPENPREKDALFTWFKAQLSNASPDKRVAFRDRTDGASDSFLDLKGRASVDRDSGILTIHSTRVIDDHAYTCDFKDTANGIIKNQTTLVITGKYYIMYSNNYNKT